MAEKLKLVFQNLYLKHQSRLSRFLKSLVFAAAMLFFNLFGPGLVSGVIFIGIALVLYARPILEPSYYTWHAFLIFLGVSLAGSQFLEKTGLLLSGTVF